MLGFILSVIDLNADPNHHALLGHFGNAWHTTWHRNFIYAPKLVSLQGNNDPKKVSVLSPDAIKKREKINPVVKDKAKINGRRKQLSRKREVQTFHSGSCDCMQVTSDKMVSFMLGNLVCQSWLVWLVTSAGGTVGYALTAFLAVKGNWLMILKKAEVTNTAH